MPKLGQAAWPPISGSVYFCEKGHASQNVLSLIKVDTWPLTIMFMFYYTPKTMYIYIVLMYS